MGKPPLPGFIIVGPQKCATTWLYKCLYEHPEVLLPESDSVHYFDMNYQKDLHWYRKFFSNYDNEKVVGEETATYIREQEAPRRIADVLPEVKLIFTLRNPIDRAYSHWWHNRSRNKHSYEFKEALENYDLYQNWVVPGFYYRHLSRYREFFPDENIKICLMDDLIEDEWSYFQDVCEFLGINDDYKPSYINRKANQGSYRFDKDSIYWKMVDQLKDTAPQQIKDTVKPIHSQIVDIMASQSEYNEGMDNEVRKSLEKIYLQDTKNLAGYLNRDLGHWFEFENIEL
jgi:hypothetical protein